MPKLEILSLEHYGIALVNYQPAKAIPQPRTSKVYSSTARKARAPYP